MKTKLLFVCVSLGLGGSERCMTEMLRHIDLNRYEVTLLALIPVDNQNQIPDGIRIINGYDGFEFCDMPMRQFVPWALRNGKLGLLARKSRYWYNITLRKADMTYYFWKFLAREIPTLAECYDVTIGYGPGLASFFAMDKVPNGGKKILWVNTNLVRAHFDLKQHRRLYDQADHVVAVCNNLSNDLIGYYPEIKEKTSVFYDMLDLEGIKRAGEAYAPDYPPNQKNKILTVGRICEAKALHLAAEAAAILKAEGLEFHWYILGDGADRPMLENRILELEVGDRVTLLGALKNPYPWFAGCDIYVQTSVYEGSCTTISEALIFDKPVVTTNIDIAPEKIFYGKNGLIAEMTGDDIAAKLQTLLVQPEIIKNMEEYIRKTSLFCGNQIEQFYSLVEALLSQ